ncbi:MAG: Electron transfer flavoprotein alpha/beta-subunit [Acidimicrobiia bacterium]|nr:Electron transfer flavoprotein alpha/beta-subunit [Acidimicrobiia bacterium]
MIAACLKWVDPRPEVDPLTGVVRVDHRRGGCSDADQTALEWALTLGQAWGQDVVAITAGPPSTESLLRQALSVGAARAIRAEVAEGASSETVAAALAAALPTDVSTIVCGAWSVDRGSGSVPAYLAAHRRSAQALGLLSLQFQAGASPRVVEAERRLDGGRRERLRVTGPMVLSVEPGLRLRRASLDGVLQSQRAPIDVCGIGGTNVASAPGPIRVGPFRPRARSLPGPAPTLSARQRILSLTGALVDRQPPRLVYLDPAEAATELLDQLERWGYR